MQVEKMRVTKNYRETQKLGENLAIQLRSEQAKKVKNRKTAVVLALSGNLGSGKTTFLKGFAKGLGIHDKILSPTFAILKRFAIPKKKIKKEPLDSARCNSAELSQKSKFTNFYHIDCLRLKNSKDILGLGFKEIIKNPENIAAIEWPEKIKSTLPQNIVLIKFKFLDEKGRGITINF